MEVFHQIINESVSSGFWKFIGYWIMISVIMYIPVKVIIVIAKLILNCNNKKHKINVRRNEK